MRDFLPAFLLLALMCVPAAGQSRPNIVLILADDLGVEALSAYGGDSYRTPHLNLLAERGVRFDHAFSTPLCTPSRVQLMTGKYSFRNYDTFGFLREGEPTFGNVFKEEGYDTCVVGKWQLCGGPKARALSGRQGSTPAGAGFDRWCLWQLLEWGGSRYKDPVLSIDDLGLKELAGDYGPDAFCRYAQDFIREQREAPFFLYYPMVLTHEPFLPTPGHPDYEDSAPLGRSDPKLFGASVEYMDTIVGRLIETLEETGKLENTIVVFLADNGTDRGVITLRNGEEVRGRKGASSQAGTHVPLIVSWPGTIPGGNVRSDLVDLTDLLPTISDCAGVTLPEDFQTDGFSLRPTLIEGVASPREWVFCHYAPRLGGYQELRWAHDHHYKLYEDGRFFDLVADAEESRSIPEAERGAEARAAAAKFRSVLEGFKPDPVPRPPNVILILTDDQGSVDTRAYGATDLRTPAMDRIAASGVRFTQFYASAPVCSPSRAALLTGRSPQAAGVPGNVSPQLGAGSGLPAEQITIAEVLGAAGYRTALIGKWHLGHDPGLRPGDQGFDYWFGHLVGCIDNWSHFFYWSGPNRHDLYRNGEEVFHDGEYFPDLMLREAKHFMLENGSRPFFLYYAVNAPHYPYQGDDNRLAHYRKRGVPYPRDLYGAFLTSTDERIGDLLDAVDVLGLTEDTIVIFQSDHGHSTEIRAHGGGGSAGPYRGAKFSLFEGGIRVPAMISWPGRLSAGEVRDQAAVATDWLPTILDLAGLDRVDHTIEGASLVPILDDAGVPSPHEELHWQYGDRWAVRHGDWKLLRKPHDTSERAEAPPNVLEGDLFLIDLADDIGERVNLAGEHPEIVEELTRLHEAWVAGGY